MHSNFCDLEAIALKKMELVCRQVVGMNIAMLMASLLSASAWVLQSMVKIIKYQKSLYQGLCSFLHSPRPDMFV